MFQDLARILGSALQIPTLGKHGINTFVLWKWARGIAVARQRWVFCYFLALSSSVGSRNTDRKNPLRKSSVVSFLMFFPQSVSQLKVKDAASDVKQLLFQ